MIIPKSPGLLCAEGLLIADTRDDFSKSRILDLNADVAETICSIFSELDAQSRSWFRKEAIGEQRQSVAYAVDMRFKGQSHELRIPLQSYRDNANVVDDLRRGFMQAHQRMYGFAPDDDMQLVTFRTVATARMHEYPRLLVETPVASVPTPALEKRDVYFAQLGGYIPCPIYDRVKLGPGTQINGPAIVEQMDSTTVVLPGQSVHVRPFGEMVMTIEAADAQHMHSDSTVVIIGGAIIGSSTAYYLARADRGVKVIVVEPDSTYEFAATPRATGTVRRTFSLPEKVAMSTYANTVYRNFAEYVSVQGELPGDASFKPGGYLYLAGGAKSVGQIEAVKRTMDAAGVRTEILDRVAVNAKFPSIFVDDIDAGLWSPDDGWIDPSGALQGFKGKARSLGVEYVKDRVVGINVEGRTARSVVLESGATLNAAHIVNCANCWAPDVARIVGMTIPVAPLRRMSYYFETRNALEPLPLTRDMNGISVRPEGRGYLAGVTDYGAPYGFNWELDYQWFEDTVWPRLASRVPLFESLKLQSCWSGHYDMSMFDRCPFVGPWTGYVDNFYVACGFSGHGLQHAPAVGRGLSELITTGRFQMLDLSRLAFNRFERNQPLVDDGPVS